MCKHVLYVLILFPASSFSITGHPPPAEGGGHIFWEFCSCYVWFQGRAAVFLQNYFYLFLFFLFSVIFDCFASHKSKKERKEKVKKEKERVSDSGWRCPTQGPLNKVGVTCVLGCIAWTFLFPMHLLWYFRRSIFHHRTLMEPPPRETCVRLRGTLKCPTQGPTTLHLKTIVNTQTLKHHTDYR